MDLASVLGDRLAVFVAMQTGVVDQHVDAAVDLGGAARHLGHAGFVGCMFVLVAYAILLFRLIAGARRAPDRMGMLVIMAIVGGLTCQVFINIGMELGILPVIGVPLPLMSAGLASLIATFIAIGFAISVQLRRFVN